MAVIAVSNNQTLSLANFQKIASYIEQNVGIKMPEQKRLMMQSRLASRLKALKMDSFDEYVDYALSGTDQGHSEIISMIDVMTTNLTQFFRESSHFDYLTNNVLPEYANQGRRSIRLWSAGCSSGQEAYTLSIVLSEFYRNNSVPSVDYKILATDISTKVLAKAKQAVYPMDAVEDLSIDLKRRYFLRSKASNHIKTKTETSFVRIKPELRNKVTFGRLNFMSDNFGLHSQMQIIFCRNVLIYFDKPTQQAVIEKFMKYLEPGGYLFLGHSETIFNMNLPLKTVAPTVFQKIR